MAYSTANNPALGNPNHSLGETIQNQMTNTPGSPEPHPPTSYRRTRGAVPFVQRSLVRFRTMMLLLLPLLCGLVVISLLLSPALVLGLVGAIGLAIALTSPLGRIGTVILGGALVLQTAPTVTSTKLAYLALVLAVGAIALMRTRHEPPAARCSSGYRVTKHALAYMGLILLSVIPTLSLGTPMTDWARDSGAYVLFAFCPMLAWDARAPTAAPHFQRMLVAFGSLGVAGFLIGWLARRGISSLAIGQLGLASFLLPAALFSLTTAKWMMGQKHRLLWASASATIFVLMLTTGTRTTFLLLAAPIGVLLTNRWELKRLAISGITFVIIAAATAVLLLPVAGSLLTSSPRVLITRLAAVRTLTDTPSLDPSFVERRRQTELAWNMFTAQPILGSGPGYKYAYRGVGRTPTETFNLDSPLAYLAKFGLMGLGMLLSLAASIIGHLRRTRRQTDLSVERSALAAYCVLSLAWLGIVGSPFEDKGFSFGFLLLFGLSIQHKLHEPHPTATPSKLRYVEP